MVIRIFIYVVCARVYQGKEVAVVGGGDSAAEEAVYLTKYASHVHLLVRSGEMRASKTMQVCRIVLR